MESRFCDEINVSDRVTHDLHYKQKYRAEQVLEKAVRDKIRVKMSPPLLLTGTVCMYGLIHICKMSHILITAFLETHERKVITNRFINRFCLLREDMSDWVFD